MKKLVFAAIVCLIMVSQSFAGLVNVNLTITADNGTTSGSQQYLVSGEASGNGLEWIMDDTVGIVSGGTQLGSIEYLKLNIWEDPAVSLEFTVAVPGSVAIEYTITAATVTFDPIVNPQAYATAGLTLTDRNQNGAIETGQYDGGKNYKAMYNSGTGVFAYLVDSFNAGIRKTVTLNEGRPADGFETINDTLTNISSQFHFQLSPYDSASGTSYFEIAAVPEPATLLMLGLGGLALLRKRKA